MPVTYTFGSATAPIPLANLDSNFATPITLGNTAIQLGNTVTTLNNMTLANATVSSGNVTVTSASLSGNLTFTGTGNRITGDFTNANAANRVTFQTSTANSVTSVGVIPNGTSQQSQISLESDPAATTGSTAQVIIIGGTEMRVQSGIRGAGTYLPMTFLTGGSEKMRLDTSGNVGIGTSSPTGGGGGTTLQIQGATAASFRLSNSGSGDALDAFLTGGAGYLQTATAIPMLFRTNATERMRIESGGNVGIGTASPAQKLDVNGNLGVGAAIFTGTGVSTGDAAIELGGNRTGSGSSYIDFHAVASTDFEFRILRSGGANGTATIANTGTGDFSIGQNGAGALVFSTNSAERARIDSSGNVLVTNPAGLGYGTGSGGTVTQATSKTTNVTLNKPTGQITMNNAALAAGASVRFQLNNTLISTNDTVIASAKAAAGTSASVYRVWTSSTDAGSVQINVDNTFTGSLSEAVVIQFFVIKGATS